MIQHKVHQNPPPEPVQGLLSSPQRRQKLFPHSPYLQFSLSDNMKAPSVYRAIKTSAPDKEAVSIGGKRQQKKQPNANCATLLKKKKNPIENSLSYNCPVFMEAVQTH